MEAESESLTFNTLTEIALRRLRHELACALSPLKPGSQHRSLQSLSKRCVKIWRGGILMLAIVRDVATVPVSLRTLLRGAVLF
eukprot:2586482-Amphidinium_carterae.1